jgi:hypothetical protein
MNRRLSFVFVVMLLLLAACTRTAQPEQPILQDLAKLAPQPPTLPIQAANKPLPQLSGQVALQTGLQSLALPTPSGRVELRLLIISAKSTDPGLLTAKTMLDQLGLPYEVLVAGESDLTEGRLVNSSGDGRFQGIILTDNSLAIYDGSSWLSALSEAEWNLLWQYEREHQVRQLSLYTFPGTYPEDYGIRVVDYKDTTNAAYPVRLSSSGQSLFASLKAGVELPIRYAYSYLARLEPASGINATPLIQDAAGNLLAVTSRSADGRERLALTMAHNPYLLHTQLFSYDLVRWLTKGIFLGERQFYLGLDEDDWFLSTDKWDASVGRVNGLYRLSAKDALAAAQQQQSLANRFSVIRNSPYPFAYTMLYNASEANPYAAYSCDPNVRSSDPLASMTKCLQSRFYWANHTWSHEYMDRIAYSDAYNQLYWNQYASYYWFGFHRNNRADYSSLITGDISGLGWYNPNGPDDPGPKVDFGLSASNLDFLRSAKARGVRYLASNMSVKSHEPSCWGCGIRHPLEPSILLVPRWPTNVFYSVTTPTDAMDAYNRIYGPNGTQPFFDHNLSYAEFLDFETDIALYHLLSGAPYPHYQHVGNLREYAPGRSLSHDWLERLLEKYSRYYDLPVLSLSWANLGARVDYRSSFMNAQVSAVWDRNSNQLTVRSAKGGWVYLTGARYGNTWSYGPATVSRFSLSAGQQVSISLGATSQQLRAEPFADPIGVSW